LRSINASEYESCVVEASGSKPVVLDIWDPT